MRVFISWSKERSLTVAEALAGWIEDVLHNAKPWVSTEDIRAGQRWVEEIAGGLLECRVGILVVTPENQHEPWLLYEAGALSKQVQKPYVCPYLVGIQPTQVTGPLTQFNAKLADEKGTLALLVMINEQLGAGGVSRTRLERAFTKYWPDLRNVLDKLPASPSPTTQVAPADPLNEILDTVRAIARRPAVSSVVDDELLNPRMRKTLVDDQFFLSPRTRSVLLRRMLDRSGTEDEHTPPPAFAERRDHRLDALERDLAAISNIVPKEELESARADFEREFGKRDATPEAAEQLVAFLCRRFHIPSRFVNRTK